MKFRLRAPHYIDDRYLESGTVIGDDTRFPISEGFLASRQMDALDDEANAMLEDIGLRVDPISEQALPLRSRRDEGPAGEQPEDVPIEKAPGVPYTPWDGKNGPEHGPDLEGNEGHPAGYDRMNASRNAPGSSAPTALADEEPAPGDRKERLRSLRVDNPNEQRQPRNVADRESDATLKKTGADPKKAK